MKSFKRYTISELVELLNAADECNWLEAKGKEDILSDSGKQSFRTLLESVCSFSNEPDQNGGIILYGIGQSHGGTSDRRYIVEGVNNIDKAQLDIATQCKESFNIPVYPEITVPPTMESNRADNSFTIRLLLRHLLDAQDIVWFGRFSAFDLNESQKTALVFLREVGAIDNLTYRQMNSCEILKASRELCAMRDMGLLLDKGKGSATYYVPGQAYKSVTDVNADSINTHGKPVNTHGEAINTHGDGSPSSIVDARQRLLLEFPEDIRERVEALGQRKNDQTMILALILDLCRARPMTKRNLAELLKRREDYIMRKYLSVLLSNNTLRYLHPEMRKHPEQAYITND